MKKTYVSMIKQQAVLGICIQMGVLCSQAMAKNYIPGFYGNDPALLAPALNGLPTLPTGAQVISGLSDGDITSDGTNMTIHQDGNRAVIHWQSYNIGIDKSVHYDQPDASSKVLNRVMGDSYSRIFGSLTATGQVYLLNQNGILFGPDSSVNVHALTASALNLDEDAFINGPDFSQGGSEIYTYSAGYPSDATVANYGTIETGNLGTAFLIAPQVENHGTITTNGGDIGLFAGERVAISQYDGTAASPSPNDEFDVIVDGGNTASVARNMETGIIQGDRAWVNVSANFVNQDGLIRTVTALEKNGKIYLRGTNSVEIGENSHTEALVSTTGERKVVDAESFQVGEIYVESSEGSIEHKGKIVSPGGKVYFNAKEQVYLEKDSSVDVSGSWVDLSAGDHVIEVQLNSEELRDAFSIKDGPLKGETVQVDVTEGLSFADISGYIKSQEKSAAELTTEGGLIQIRSESNLIAKEGSHLDFSGGGIFFSEGLLESTKVRIGTRIYNLADVPQGVPIDQVLNQTDIVHSRYGITDNYYGVSYGGAYSSQSYLPAFFRGSNGGTLDIESRKVVLDGTLNASAIRGLYQNALEDPTSDEYGYLTAIGQAVPRSGTLKIGSPYFPGASFNDLVTDSITIKKEVAATTVTAGEALPDSSSENQISEISSETLNAAGLGRLELYANNAIEITEDAKINLADLGKVDFQARNITHLGSVKATSGEVTFTIPNNISGAFDKPERIYLGPQSVIDVSGERVDNSRVDIGTPYQYGFTDGGSVTFIDDNDKDSGEIIMLETSTLDVSGGYSIERGGSAKGGDAGAIEMQANTVHPDGQLIGLAMEGAEGGSVSIHTDLVTLTADEPPAPIDIEPYETLPPDLAHNLVLSDQRFNGSGFSHIELKSQGHLNVESGVSLTPSLTRLARPVRGTSGYSLTSERTATSQVQEIGATSLSLAAGETIYEQQIGVVNIAEGASLSVAAGQGEISLSGHDGVMVAGSLTARGGEVNLNATNNNIQLASTAKIDVSGTTLPDYDGSILGYPLNRTLIQAGKINLSALLGNINLEAGSLLDISGSPIVTNYAFGTIGRVYGTRAATNAGSINASFKYEFNDDGEIRANKALSSLAGGSLSVEKNSIETGTSTLAISEDDVSRWTAQGFDDLSFSSMRTISFLDSAAAADGIVDISTNRHLSLNGSQLIGTGDQDIRLSSHWLELTNIVPGTDQDGQKIRVTAAGLTEGTATLSADGDYIDIKGDLALNGFQQTAFTAANDLRLYDYFYSNPTKKWSGALRTTADITLQAGAIYPGMHFGTTSGEDKDNFHNIYPSKFTISSGTVNAAGDIVDGGRITILAPEKPLDRVLYSAGGKLFLQAGEIEHHGVLAAPMGEIELKADQVGLFDGSVLSTRGETNVLYGQLLKEQWQVTGYMNPNGGQPVITVDSPPENSVNIDAAIITQSPEAAIDIGGGGSILAYEFLPGYDGTVNPLARNDRMVILPDNSVSMPGETVYLDGMKGLAAGFYTVLPAEYAFLPGALVIEKTGKTLPPGQTFVNQSGYNVVAGFEGTSANNEVPSLREGYIVRDAIDVLGEGRFDIAQLVTGAGGSVSLNAATTILAGPIYGDSLPGFTGGSLNLAGTDIFLNLATGAPDESWWQNYTFETEIPDQYKNRLMLTADKITGKGLTKLRLGDENTQTVTFGDNTVITDIPEVEIIAQQSIDLGASSEIYAQESSAHPGKLILTTETLYGSESYLHASDLLELNINYLSDYTFTGDIAVDHGKFAVYSDFLYIQPENYGGARGDGFNLSARMYDAFSGIDEVVLSSKNDLTFLGTLTLDAKDNLTLDAARMTVSNNVNFDPTQGPPEVQPYTINILAGKTLRLQNSSQASSLDDTDDLNTITFNAETIVFGSGDIKLDNFKEINVRSLGDTVFSGEGSLNADLASGNTLSFNAQSYLSALTIGEDIDGDQAVLTFTPSDYMISSPTGNIAMEGNGTNVTSQTAQPGSLQVNGSLIDLQNAFFNMPGGLIDFSAGETITLTNSTVQATGGSLNVPITINNTVYDNSIVVDGGIIGLHTDTDTGGAITIDSLSTLDTSSATGLGGTIILESPQGGIVLDGTIKGASLVMDTTTINNFSSLASLIQGGGFNRELYLRARQGDVTVNYADIVKSDLINLIVDNGSIDIWGKFDSSGADQGGAIGIYALGDLTLERTAQLLASGEGENSEGGKIFLSSLEGGIQTFGLAPEEGAAGSLIDVSGTRENGSVNFRGARQAILDQKIQLAGDILGDTSPTLQAFEVYHTANGVDITATDVNSFMTDSAGDMPALQTALNNDTILLVPEIEIASDTDLKVTSGLNNLSSFTGSQFSGTPGVLTFRAAGNVQVSSNIIDLPGSTSSTPTSIGNVFTPVADDIQNSWGLNFIAGADFTSSSFQSVIKGQGDFTIGGTQAGQGRLIYTEDGEIHFAAGRDVIIHGLDTSGNAKYVPQMYMPGTNRYNLASFAGDITGYAGRDLLLQGGVIQTAVSDIDIRTGGNITILNKINGGTGNEGAIRTTGRAPLVSEVADFADPQIADNPALAPYLPMMGMERFWDYRDGGNISLAAGGSVKSDLAQPETGGWDFSYTNNVLQNIGATDLERYGAMYGVQAYIGTNAAAGQATHGIATMAGGNIDIRAGELDAQVGAFQDGDVGIYTLGDLDGRFLAAGGDLRLTSLANFGNTAGSRDTLVELGSGIVSVSAMGNVSLGTISNPSLTRLGEGNDKTWNLTYSESSAASLNSLLGNIHFSGSHDFISIQNNYRNYLLPSSLSATAANNIIFSLNKSNPYVLAPAANGNLSLIAGRDIAGRTQTTSISAEYSNSSIIMSAADPSSIYQSQGVLGLQGDSNMQSLLTSGYMLDALHENDLQPVEVKAGMDISNIALSVPKSAEIEAERDIIELRYWAQNLHSDDISLVSAGNDIVQLPYDGKNTTDLLINQAGKGALMVLAGNSIDLGSSAGISATGSQIARSLTNNNLFEDQDKDELTGRYKAADVLVMSGYQLNENNLEGTLDPVQFADFFQELRIKGTEFSTLMATGLEEDERKAAQLKTDMVENLISPMFGVENDPLGQPQEGNLHPVYRITGSGNIAMTQSSIKSTSGQDNIYIISNGQIDVGTSIISKDEDTSKGILTEGGGGINILAEHDINVNESRIVTYLGGDIFALSNSGNINAGRGSKTAVSSQAAGYVTVGGKLADKFTAPAPGSGIRTLTADADGDGPLRAPKQGGIYLIAWNGIIDAGEAGISAGDLVLAANSIQGAENISATGTEVGAPATGDAGPSLGALSGATTVSESQSSTESMVEMSDTGKQLAEAISRSVESLNLKSLVFKVVDYSDEMTEEDEKSKSQKNKI